MFGRNLKLFRLFGFEVRVNISWAFLAVLIAVSLAQGFFPSVYIGWPKATYWWMAAAGVAGVFFSIVVHELSHSIAARAFGMQMRGITLFLFGGIAEMEDEPKSAKAELVMALAGPAISLVLAGLCLGAAGLAQGSRAPTPAWAVVEYVGWLNLVLAAFNMVPAFPMDGGRALRAALWSLKGNIRWATKWASRMGAAFGLLLIVAGIGFALTGAFVQGLWWFLIGMFIRAAAQGSYLQMEVRRMMGGLTVADVMQTEAHAVSPDTTLADLVQHYVYQFQQTEFPVRDGGRLAGVVGVPEIKKLNQADWPHVQVRDIMRAPGNADLLSPGQDAVSALQALQSGGRDMRIVAQNGRDVGILSKADVMKLLSLRMDLETA